MVISAVDTGPTNKFHRSSTFSVTTVVSETTVLFCVVVAAFEGGGVCTELKLVLVPVLEVT